MASKRAISWEAIVGVCAIVTAMVAIVVGVQQTRLQQQTLSASVWPFVVLDITMAYPDGRPRLALEMVNNGVGPAKIETFTLSYRGKAYASSRELVHDCCHGSSIVYSNFLGGVLAAHDRLDYLTAEYTPENRPHWAALSGMAQGIAVRMCYCSVLDDCWITASPAEKPPEPVRACPAARGPQYQG